MIIGINGYMGSGKDTVGSIIQYLTDKNVNGENFAFWYASNLYSVYENSGKWEIKKFAGKLKQIASLLTGIPVEKFEDQEFKNSYLPADWSSVARKPIKRQDGIFGKGEAYIKPMTVREFLQRLGTDAVRNALHDNTWVNALMADYTPNWTENTKQYWKDKMPEIPNWIVTDCRFPNEAEAILNKNGVIIRVNRPSNIIETTELKLKHISEIALDLWEFDYVIENDGSIEDLISKVKVILQELNIIS